MVRGLGIPASAALLLALAPAGGAQDAPRPAAVQASRLQALTAQQRPAPAPDAPQVVPVDWVAAREDARTQFSRNGEISTAAVRQVAQFPRPSNAQAAEVVNTNLPVLVPTVPALRIDGEPRVQLFPRENFYTLSIGSEDLTIEVFGTRLAHAQLPDARTRRNMAAATGGGYQIARTEYGRELNFARYGAAYSITVECAAPETDPRCTSDDYVLGLFNSLIMAAGTPNEGEQ